MVINSSRSQEGETLGERKTNLTYKLESSKWGIQKKREKILESVQDNSSHLRTRKPRGQTQKTHKAIG